MVCRRRSLSAWVGTLESGLIGRALFGADGRWGSWLLGLVVTVVLVVVGGTTKGEKRTR